MLASYLREEFRRSLFSRLAGLVALPVINAFRRRVDHRQYNGASLLGLRGVVIKVTDQPTATPSAVPSGVR